MVRDCVLLLCTWISYSVFYRQILQFIQLLYFSYILISHSLFSLQINEYFIFYSNNLYQPTLKFSTKKKKKKMYVCMCVYVCLCICMSYVFPLCPWQCPVPCKRYFWKCLWIVELLRKTQWDLPKLLRLHSPVGIEHTLESLRLFVSGRVRAGSLDAWDLYYALQP